MTSYVIVRNSMSTVMLRLQSVVSCNIILVRKRNCLLDSCVIYAGESGGFDGAGAAGDVFSRTGREHGKHEFKRTNERSIRSAFCLPMAAIFTGRISFAHTGYM